MITKQLSIFLENKRGQLSGICKSLASAGINISALSLADTADFGIVRMIVDNHELAFRTLRDAGFAVSETDVVTVTVPDTPGDMASLTEKLDCAGVDIEYSYAYALGKGESAILVFRFNDNARAMEALKID